MSNERRALMREFRRTQMREFAKSRLPETKASAVGAQIAVQNVGQPVWMAREPAKFAQEGYQKNSVVFRCITEVARGMATIPLCLYNGDVEVDTHPLLDLLNRPNPWQGNAAFFEGHFAYWLISGNNYLEAVEIGGAPKELYSHRPDRMRIIPSSQGTVQAFNYEVNGRSKRFEMDPVTGAGPILHFKTFHPLDDWYGMSPLEAAAYSVDQHNSAGAWNQAMLQNNCRPSGALVYEPNGMAGATLTDAQFQQLNQQIDEKMSGSNNARRPFILDGGLKWMEMGLSPMDMDWLNGKNSTARDICMAFGVPPACLGIPGTQTHANYEEARLSLYEETVIPFLNGYIDALNNWLVPAFTGGQEGTQLRIVADIDEIPALANRRAQVWAQVEKCDFMTINEKRKKIGYTPIDGGDVIYIEATKIPLGATSVEEIPPGKLPATDPKQPAPPAKASEHDHMQRVLQDDGFSQKVAQQLVDMVYGG